MDPLASFVGDGAYDQSGIYGTVTECHPAAEVIVPPRSTAVLSEDAETTPTQRDWHLQNIAEHGRMAWQSRLKRVIGDALRSRTDGRRATEVAIAISALNRMPELGRPESVRVA